MSTSVSLLSASTRAKVSKWQATLREADIPFQVTSTRRSRSEQEELFRRFQAGESDLPAAPPGTSKHEFGRAVDVVFETEDDLADAVELAADQGLEWFGMDDPVHFEDVEGVEATLAVPGAFEQVVAAGPPGTRQVVEFGREIRRAVSSKAEEFLAAPGKTLAGFITGRLGISGDGCCN